MNRIHIQYRQHIADENNSYTYNAYGELVGVSGTNNSSYTYDERGNLLSKTVNGETISFVYENDNWKDQLTKVNATELAYDANGSLTSYGDKQYTWSYGKCLESITDSENTYSYKYDENGIRASKTVNGATTEFNTLNGVILAQKNSAGILYFQYDSAGTPVGFVYNDVQYLYITNLSGDIVGFTDAQGNLLAEYAYDEWGKLLSIEAEGEENQAIAELNPLRYRGYYYDNETGYYYLQSRYYDPNICRFISADSFEYIDTTNRFTSNAYVYCWNCPIAFDDAEGTTPKLSFDISKIKAFIVKIEGYIERTKNKLSDVKDWIVGKWQKLVERYQEFKEKIKSKFDEFGEKVKFRLHNFYIYVNDIYKQITGRDLNIFRIVEFVIEKIHNNDIGNAEQGISVLSTKSRSSENNNLDMAIVQGLFGGIVINQIYIGFKSFNIDLDDILANSIKNNWYGIFQELMFTGIAIFSAGSMELDNYILDKEYFTDGTTYFFQKLIDANEDAGDFEVAGDGRAFLGVLSILGAVISLVNNIENAGNGVLSKNTDVVLSITSFAFDILSSFIDIPFVGILVSSAGNIIPKVIAMRIGGFVLC